MDTFKEFNFKISTQRQDVIKAFESLMETFEINNESSEKKKIIVEALDEAEICSNIDWIESQMKIVRNVQEISYRDYYNHKFLLDLFCVVQIRNNAIKIFYDWDINLEYDASNYEYFCSILDIKLEKFASMLGKKLFDEWEDDEESLEAHDIIGELIGKRYDEVVEVLIQHYGNTSNMLSEMICDSEIDNEFNDAMDNISTFQDCFDNVEAMKLHSWAQEGFPLGGR